MKKFLLAALVALSSAVSGNLNAATYYWVGNGGSWSDFANHWATTSGGMVYYNQAPTANDDVVFDANSFTVTSQTVTINGATAYCRSFLIQPAVANSPTFVQASGHLNLQVSGSLLLQPGIVWSYNALISFHSASSSENITTAGHALQNISFENATGTWTQTDSLRAFNVYLNRGTYRTANYPLSCFSFYFGNQYYSTFKAGTSRLYPSNWYARHFGHSTIDVDSTILYLGTNFEQSAGASFNIIQSNVGQGTIQMDSCSVDTMNVTGSWMSILGRNNYFNRVVSNGNFIIGANNTFHYCDFRANVRFENLSSCTFDTLFLNNPGFDVEIHPSVTITLNNALVTPSLPCAQLTRIYSMAAGQATFNKSSGAIVCSGLSLKDVRKTGSATFTANNSYNAGNVTGWTINSVTPRTLYWVGNGGSWTDSNHWSLTSGGSPGACPPILTDSVILDQNSFSLSGQVVTITLTNLNIRCLNAMNVTNNPSITATQSLFAVNCTGSFQLPYGLNWTYAGTKIYMISASGAHTFQTGNNFFSELSFLGSGSARWNWLDSARGDYLSFYGGILDFQMNYLQLNSGFSLNTTGSGHMDFGNATIRCSFLMFSPVPTVTTDADSCQFIVGSNISMQHNTVFDTVITVNGNAGPVGIDGLAGQINHLIVNHGTNINYSGMIYNDIDANTTLTVQGGGSTIRNLNTVSNVSITNNCTIDTVRLNNPGYSFNINLNKTVTTKMIYGTGSCTGLIAIQGAGTPTSSNDQAFIVSNSGSAIGVSDIILSNIDVSGSSVFTANNAVVSGHVTGWNYTTSGPSVADTLYWVGDSGSWYDPAHWSQTSGGSPGSCIPQIADDVIFDGNSFSSSGQVDFLNGNAYCHNITCSGVSVPLQFIGNFIFNPVPAAALNVSGSMNLQPGIDWDYEGYVIFTGNERNRTIAAAGTPFAGVLFDGTGGSWILTDSFVSLYRFFHTAGKLNTNGHHVRTDQQLVINDTLLLGTSTIECYEFLPPTNQTWTGVVDADSATIQCYVAQGYGLHIKNLEFREIGWTNNSLNIPYAEIDNFTTDGFGFTYADGTDTMYIHHATAEGDFVIYGPVIFDYAEFRDEIAVKRNTTFDTLVLNNAGHMTTIDAGDTVSVSDMLMTQGSPSFPLTIQSDNAGSQTYIQTGMDTVCMEYMNLRDLVGIGPTIYHAGFYSQDLGNNSGISFTPCVIPVGDVWPGDANYDLVVDNNDVLYVGLAFNETGITRDTASLNWWAQPCVDWNRIFNNGVNIHNADCDGNGTIDSTDLAAVYQNYNLSHPAFAGPPLAEEPMSVADLWLDPPTLNYTAGAYVTIPVKMGTSGNPVVNVYGVAYDISYDSSRIVPGTVYMTYPANWFTPINNSLSFQRDDWSSHQIDDSQSRTDLTNVSGNGSISYLHFQIDSMASGLLPLSIINVNCVDNVGTAIGLTPIGTTLIIDTPLVAGSLSFNPDVNLYPNPTSGNTVLTLHSYISETLTVELLDVNGQLISATAQTVVAGQDLVFEIPMEHLSSGVYICRVTGESTAQNIRLVKSE